MTLRRTNDDGPGLVQEAAERVARGELLRRSGKFAVGVAVGNWLLGQPATAAADPDHMGSNCPCVGSIHCAQVGFGCSCVGAECRIGGNVCAKRFNACPSGGYCWTECCTGQKITSCDYTCAGFSCHCATVIGSCGSPCCPCGLGCTC